MAEDVEFTWSLVEFKEEALTFKLTFKHASKISSTEGSPNVLQVKVLEPSLFVRKRDSINVQSDSAISIILPQQVSLILESGK